MQDLLNLRLCGCTPWYRLPTPEEVLEWFKLLEAGWMHDGDPKKPHAKLHSGKCSTGFFLCKRVLKYPNLREILAACLVSRLHLERVDGVFGGPYSSILLAGDVGRLLGVPTYVPEKDPSDPAGKRMIFKPDDPIPEGSVLLQIEELVTTFDSGDATMEAIVLGNPHKVFFTPEVGVLVHRPPKFVRDSTGHGVLQLVEQQRKLSYGRTIVPFIEKQIDACNPEDCNLCLQGSVPLPPKGANWAKLTA